MRKINGIFGDAAQLFGVARNVLKNLCAWCTYLVYIYIYMLYIKPEIKSMTRLFASSTFWRFRRIYISVVELRAE